MTDLFHAVGACCERAASRTGALSGEFAASFVFPPDFCGFAGHFPTGPILPGIAQIMAVQHAAGDTGLTLGAVKSCKFVRPVSPGERIAVTGVRMTKEEGVTVTATLRSGDELCATMTLELIPC